MFADLKASDPVIVCLPPGWLLAGRVADVTPEFLILRPALWIEAPGAPITALQAEGATATTAHGFRGEMRIARAAVLWIAQASESLADQGVTQALEGGAKKKKGG